MGIRRARTTTETPHSRAQCMQTLEDGGTLNAKAIATSRLGLSPRTRARVLKLRHQPSKRHRSATICHSRLPQNPSVFREFPAIDHVTGRNRTRSAHARGSRCARPRPSIGAAARRYEDEGNSQHSCVSRRPLRCDRRAGQQRGLQRGRRARGNQRGRTSSGVRTDVLRRCRDDSRAATRRCVSVATEIRQRRHAPSSTRSTQAPPTCVCRSVRTP